MMMERFKTLGNMQGARTHPLNTRSFLLTALQPLPEVFAVRLRRTYRALRIPEPRLRLCGVGLGHRHLLFARRCTPLARRRFDRKAFALQ